MRNYPVGRDLASRLLLRAYPNDPDSVAAVYDHRTNVTWFSTAVMARRRYSPVAPFLEARPRA
jgi:hypothetical protein